MENSKTLQKELTDLQGRIQGAHRELARDNETDSERKNLFEQIVHMNAYADVLKRRIAEAKSLEQKGK